MNKTALISVIVVIILVILGVVVYSKSGGSMATSTAETSNGTMMEHEGDMMATSTATTTGSTVDVGVNVGVSTDKTKTFVVTGDNFKFMPSTMTVKKGDTVKIVFKNANGFHDLKLDEFNVATAQLKAGAEETVTFVATKTGSFEYYCSVGNHRAMGMKGTLTVTE